MKWHIITLQEAIEYLDHEFLTNRFHATHYGGCAVLFKKDTFHPDIKVSSVYLHDTRGSSEWAKMNLDTGAAVNTFPSNFGPEGIGDGSFYDWIPDGEAWQFQGYDENGLPRSLNERFTDAHQVLDSNASAFATPPASGAARIACKEQQDFYVGYNSGYMIPTYSKHGQGMRIHFGKLLNEHGKNELIPVHLENDTPNFS